MDKEKARSQTVETEFGLSEYAGNQKLTQMEGGHKNGIESPVDLGE